MPKSALTGTRIRERRQQLGMRQIALAQASGVSASYLNLIEHNRRRIGGRVLIAIARALDVEPNALTEGAEAALLAGLQSAAGATPDASVETDRSEEFAGRFPGWASLVARQHNHIADLEQKTAALTDRLTHDPQLASSLHEVLSVVTAIRSTSAILADGQQVDPEWQTRFHRNLYEDSQRLAESSQALVAYLDAVAEDDEGGGAILPQEELETWLIGRDFRIPEIETGDADVTAILEGPRGLTASPAASSLARAYLDRALNDARAIPTDGLTATLAMAGPDPSAVAEEFKCDLATAMRRLATMAAPDAPDFGLVTCDASGTLTFRKSVEGFALPRYGAACPLWPLYQALMRPQTPVSAVVQQAGHVPRTFQTYAICQAVGPVRFDQPQAFEATMLIVPDPSGDADLPILPVGTSCRICPRGDCGARREPSILKEGA